MNEPIFFPTQNLFRAWLKNNHDKETELIVGYFKVKSGIPSMTWSQSVDQALCYGWIDGVRRSIDKDSYQIRFTPRKIKSIWSPTNLKKIKVLTKEGHMRQSGIDVFNKRPKSKESDYSFTQKVLNLPKEYKDIFMQNTIAWDYFEALAPSYKKLSVHWVTSAVQEKTKLKRLNELIAMSEKGTNKWKNNKYKKK